ncbi:MAG TPA: choice-of-anchor tandem repeat GloVer-containing protein [Terriglobales bacterium]|nr:choice-of-anchor tandem repeat GloVer-containing protein [Terriglobales bacterium]
MTKTTLGKIACVVAACCVATAVASPAQTVATIASFNGTNGQDPKYGPLVQGLNGNYYGTTLYGGGHENGNVFEISAAGKVTNLHSFCATKGCPDGATPTVGLLLAPNGRLYGTTSGGGAHGAGTVFEIVPGGEFTTLYSFCSAANCADGVGPNRLVLGSNGNFYGTSYNGGANNYGTVFEITPAGELTTLYNFCSKFNSKTGICLDGAYPALPLILGTDGNFYGITTAGGSNNCRPAEEAYGCGMFFRVTPAGKLSAFALFTSSNGWYPNSLLQGADGNFYGTTLYGGPSNPTNCTDGCGTAFQITPSGAINTLYNFCSEVSCTDGAGPMSLMQATDGNLYGTAGGGSEEQGVIFQLTTGGSLNTVYDFCETCGGFVAYGTLLQATNGNFYGTTFEGFNQYTNGTVYSLSMGLSPFVQANPTFGKVGYTIDILGNNLTGATGVTFNGTPTTFTVVSPSLIKAAVPSGATAGTIEVTTPSGTLSSNVAFQVLP